MCMWVFPLLRSWNQMWWVRGRVSDWGTVRSAVNCNNCFLKRTVESVTSITQSLWRHVLRSSKRRVFQRLVATTAVNPLLDIKKNAGLRPRSYACVLYCLWFIDSLWLTTYLYLLMPGMNRCSEKCLEMILKNMLLISLGLKFPPVSQQSSKSVHIFTGIPKSLFFIFNFPKQIKCRKNKV